MTAAPAAHVQHPHAGLVRLAPITARACPLDAQLWALLTKAGPLTASEWAYVDERERQAAQEDHASGES